MHNDLFDFACLYQFYLQFSHLKSDRRQSYSFVSRICTQLPCVNLLHRISCILRASIHISPPEFFLATHHIMLLWRGCIIFNVCYQINHWVLIVSGHACGTAYNKHLTEMHCTGAWLRRYEMRGSRAGAIFAEYRNISSLLHTDHRCTRIPGWWSGVMCSFLEFVQRNPEHR
ncbi:hypothetical protein PAXRUDRAFT_428666 [Paxillus rubicundulus Ve08.2h10]|uniref:Uncharacterized protein n=1 Tax=Paxillus rubicundulus Ve08.2h10 TaxID=930991 RepID=A0A0D0DQJ7_9AGAM|nr:hypothetical protein PAXRUDRAFT_428666 [Paxillus rubicundulus Ve08.2h10]